MSWYSLSVKPIDEYTSAVIAGIWRSISVAALLGLVLALVFIGCGSGFRWEGEWEGNRNIPPKEGENPYLIRTIGQVSLTIEAGNFKMTETGVPYTGTVRYEDGKAVLRIETRFNIPIEKEPPEIQAQMKEIVLTPGKDGTITFVNPGGAFTEPLTLKRKVKKA